jgi:hypothetical protein
MNFNVLRAADSKHFGLSVRRSTFPQAGYGVFGTRNTKKGQIVGWYNGTLVVATLIRGARQCQSSMVLCSWFVRLAVLRNMVYSFSTSSTGLQRHGFYSRPFVGLGMGRAFIAVVNVQPRPLPCRFPEPLSLRLTVFSCVVLVLVVFST